MFCFTASAEPGRQDFLMTRRILTHFTFRSSTLTIIPRSIFSRKSFQSSITVQRRTRIYWRCWLAATIWRMKPKRKSFNCEISLIKCWPWTLLNVSLSARLYSIPLSLRKLIDNRLFSVLMARDFRMLWKTPSELFIGKHIFNVRYIF